MFIRSKEVVDKKTGNKYRYYRLVESYSVDETIKQRTVLYLGKLDLSKEQLKMLAKLIEIRIYKRTENIHVPVLSELADKFYNKYCSKLAEASKKEEKASSALYREVDINTTTTTDHRSFGSEFVLNSFWKRLKMDKILSEQEFSNKEKAIAKALILGRIISPGSELHTYRWLQDRSSLNEFSGHDLSTVGKDSFYAVGDYLYDFKDQIEIRLREEIKKSYSFKDTIYLYDLTNTYFESSKPGSNLAKFGKSKEKRYDCPLVTLALVVDQQGFPVYSKIYEGNKSEPLTFPEILEKVIDRNHRSGSVSSNFSIVMDRGIATSENIEHIKSKGYSYFVIERREAVKDFKQEFTEKEKFTEYETHGKEKVYLKKIENDSCARVLVYSHGKESKEQAIVSKKEQHLLEDLKQLVTSNENGNIVKSDKIHQRIGRLKQKYGSIASCYNFSLKYDTEKTERVIKISYSKSKKKVPVKKEYAGCYVIETDQRNYSEKEIWDIYMQLHQVESAFCAMKSELGTRPIYHQKDDRIKSHLFISVLAYSIMHSVQHELQKAGYSKSWTRINEILSTHQRCTIEMETRQMKQIKIRVSGKPEKCHKDIYNRLKLNFNENRKIEENVIHF